MKVVPTLALLALASAHSGDDDYKPYGHSHYENYEDAEGYDGEYGAPVESYEHAAPVESYEHAAPVESYEHAAPVESYEGEEADGAEDGVYEPYSPPVVAAQAFTCLGTCPADAKCQDIATGNCYRPEYHAGGESEPTEKGTRFLVEDEEYKKGQQYEGLACPAGTIDVACNRLGSTVVLWVGFALLFAPALYFYYLAFHDAKYMNHSHTNCYGSTDFHDVQHGRFLCFVVVFIASLAYLTMALGYGNTVNCTDGREFFYVRYIDWVFTTPIMLYKLTSRTNLAEHETAFIIFMDILMIVSGLIGAFAVGTAKWIFFAFSMFTFLPIIVSLYFMSNRVTNSPTFGKYWSRAAWLTFFIWMQYPIVWVLSEGTGTLCSSAEAIWYTILDVLAKSLFGFMLVSGPANFVEDGHHIPPTNGYSSGQGQRPPNANAANHNQPAGNSYY